MIGMVGVIGGICLICVVGMAGMISVAGVGCLGLGFGALVAMGRMGVCRGRLLLSPGSRATRQGGE